MTPRRLSPGLALLALAGLLGGCAVGPSARIAPPPTAGVRSPDSLTTPEARRFLDSLNQVRQRDTGLVRPLPPRPLALDSGSDQPWLEVLKDPQVIALVQTAMANNRDLQSAIARVREYRALLGVARGDLFPQLSLNAAASKQQSVFGSFPVQKFNIARLTGDLSWELDFWGRLRRQTEAAGFDLKGREEDERAAVISLVSDVVTTYLQLRELDQSLAISEQTLESRRATLALAQRRFTEGVISELDVRQFEAEVAAPAARVADFARQRAEREHQLNVLLGQLPGPIPRGQPLETVVQAVAVPDSIPAALLLRRPDVRRAERDAQAAYSRIGLALGNRLPKVTIVGQYGRQDQTVHNLFDKNHEIYSGLVGLSFPLFTGGKLLDQQRAARARADQARAHYEQTVLSAFAEADDALVGVRLGRDQLTAQQTEAQALARAYALAVERYQNGVSSYLEVLDAQRSLYNAQLTLVSQERQYLGATVRLYKALGGSWK